LGESGLHLPPKVAKKLDGLLVAAGLTYFGQYVPLERKLALILEVNPEGTLYLLHGSLLGGQEKFDEAITSFELAANTPAILPETHRDARVMLALLLAHRAAVLETGSEEDLAKAVQLIEEVLDNKPLPTECYLTYYLAAQKAKQWTLARRLLERWEPLVPADEKKLFRYRQIEVAHETGDYFNAHRLALEILSDEPEHEVAIKIRDVSQRKMRERIEPEKGASKKTP
jgi:tetratricopeptide (TPR) repeat protein